MSCEVPIVLAISPRSTRLGVAVFQDEYLLYYGLVGLWSKQIDPRTNVESKIRRLIDTHESNFLVLEKLVYPQQRTESLTHLYECLFQTATAARILVEHYDPRIVRRQLQGNGRPNKQTTALYLAAHYPELKTYTAAQNNRQRIYWDPVLNAIALGLYAIRRYAEKTPRSKFHYY